MWSWSYLIAPVMLGLAWLVFGLLRADAGEEEGAEETCGEGACQACAKHHQCGDDFSFHQPMTDPRQLFKDGK